MKKTILLLFLSISISGYSQYLNCDNIDRYELGYVYKQNKSSFIVIKDDIDYMANMINKVNILTLKQICINTWGIYNSKGLDYLYARFSDSYGYIDKEYYLQNIEYLEILAYLKFSIKNKL